MDPKMVVIAITVLLVAGRVVAASSSWMHCNGAVGECVEQDEEMMMESESSRRVLAQGKRYISYGALKRNSVPCSRRGNSYYNCNSHGQANPYKRGCSAITRCARNTG